MIAVAFYSSSIVSSWLWMALLVAGIGATPVLGWVASAFKRPGVRRVLVAFFVAMLLGTGTLYAADYCCCDPFWIIFWICLAP